MRQIILSLVRDLIAFSRICRNLVFYRTFSVRSTSKEDIQKLLQDLYPVFVSLRRLGGNGDGGYLVPDDLEGIEACFSPGVGTISNFEKECSDLKIKTFLADASVESPAIEDDSLYFVKKYVGAMNDENFITMDEWVSSSSIDEDTDLMLQMDVEGFEYEIFLNMSEELLRRFRIIVVEFHNLDQLWNNPFFSLSSRVFKKILQTHFCVHLHPNNNDLFLKAQGLSIPLTMEFTFLRRDRANGNLKHAVSFPHYLDRKNNSVVPYSSVLPSCWYNK